MDCVDDELCYKNTMKCCFYCPYNGKDCFSICDDKECEHYKK